MNALWLLSTLPILILEGIFSGSEIALISADRLKLQTLAKKGSRRAVLALELVQNPHRILATSLLVSSLCIIGISSLVTFYFYSHEVRHPEMQAIIFTSPLVVIFGELLPKTLYRKYSETIAPVCALIITAAYYFFLPITFFLALYTARISRLLSPLSQLLGTRRTRRDDLRSLLTESSTKSTEMKTAEARMVKRIFDFQKAEAKKVFIPLVKVDALEETETVEEAIKAFQKNGHSRLPVYRERIDHIVGILRITDLLKAANPNTAIKGFLKKPFFVPETQTLNDLLKEMQNENTEMAIVVDEHGGAVGILTSEDIMEEVVGEIEDEFDTQKPLYRQLKVSTWTIEAKMELNQINEIFHFEIPHGDYETLGGFLLQQFRRIPENGDELYFDTPAGSFRFTIQHSDERRIHRVLIDRLSQS